jgi:hypothetical protein
VEDAGELEVVITVVVLVVGDDVVFVRVVAEMDVAEVLDTVEMVDVEMLVIELVEDERAATASAKVPELPVLSPSPP